MQCIWIRLHVWESLWLVFHMIVSKSNPIAPTTFCQLVELFAILTFHIDAWADTETSFHSITVSLSWSIRTRPYFRQIIKGSRKPATQWHMLFWTISKGKSFTCPREWLICFWNFVCLNYFPFLFYSFEINSGFFLQNIAFVKQNSIQKFLNDSLLIWNRASHSRASLSASEV